MEDKYQAAVAGIGIVCVTAIEMFAIEKGVNGTLLAATVGMILTVVGLCFGIVLGRRQ